MGATPQDVGPGVQPQPSKPHPAHGVGALRGSRKQIPALNGNRSAHAPIAQRGQRPAPRPLKAGGQPGRCPASSRSRRGTRTAATKASTARVARPLEPPCGASGMRARYWEGMTGVQPGKVACPPRDQRAADPVGLRWKRLLLPSGRVRRSARRSHPTVMLGVIGQASAWLDRRCLGRGGSASWPVSASMMGASGARGNHKTSGRPWARVAASFLSGQTQTAE